MADIFLSYTHADRDGVRPLVDFLEREGWSVWWDRVIEPGDRWQEKLNETLAKVRAVVVVWSAQSIASEWVQHEAAAGLEMNALVPMRLDDVVPPEPFDELQATDVSALTSGKKVAEAQTLLRRLVGLVPPSRIDTVRPGYDPAFLGEDLELGLPGITGTAAVLRYLHFTVIMNPARRLAHYVAYNMDGTKLGKAPRGNDWAPDPLLPDSLQMGMETLRRSEYDRGHLVSRANVMWGDEREVSIAGRQAFYWTNISPQYQELNRRWWLALERWERDVAVDRGRATGFSGLVCTEDDERFRDEVELEDGLVAQDSFRIPRGYWKVVLSKGDNGLQFAAFYLDQTKMMGGKVERPFRIEKYRMALCDLEEMTQLRFAAVYHEAKELSREN